MKKLCSLADLPNPGSKSFTQAQQPQSFFIVRNNEDVRAYINSCPHTGAPLNWQPDVFLDVEEKLIQCSLHMALFDIPTGKCLAGPCVGQGLEPVPIEVVGDDIFLCEE